MLNYLYLHHNLFFIYLFHHLRQYNYHIKVLKFYQYLGILINIYIITYFDKFIIVLFNIIFIIIILIIILIIFQYFKNLTITTY
jgi:hypothetical protein